MKRIIWIFRGILVLCMVAVLIAVCAFEKAYDNDKKVDLSLISKNEVLPEYLVENMNDLHLGEPFELENYFITNKRAIMNYYVIDENHVLWGYGNNDYGQLGTGESGNNESMDDCTVSDPQKIAEHVVHVDMGGSNFAIFLTESGDLYGMGANLNELVNVSKFFASDLLKQPDTCLWVTPKLLLEDVAYARCGDSSIIAMKKDGSVWWWGEFISTSSISGKCTNSVRFSEPHKMLEDAMYVTEGSECAGAIKKDGSLWVWGNNTFGSLGINEESDFVNEPRKVKDHVKMVWFDSISFNTKMEKDAMILGYGDSDPYEYYYFCDTFVEDENGTLSACGLEVQGFEKKIRECVLYGDISYKDKFGGNGELFQIPYTDVFTRIKITENR